MSDDRMSRLEREMDERADLFGRLLHRFGPAVLDEVADTVGDRAERAMKNAPLEHRGLDAVMELLWDHMGDLADVTVVERTPTRLSLRVSKCVFAERMRDLDAAQIGHACYCAYDDGFCRGLNPRIRFTRTKTLMQGDACCDHTYELANE